MSHRTDDDAPLRLPWARALARSAAVDCSGSMSDDGKKIEAAPQPRDPHHGLSSGRAGRSRLGHRIPPSSASAGTRRSFGPAHSSHGAVFTPLRAEGGCSQDPRSISAVQLISDEAVPARLPPPDPRADHRRPPHGRLRSLARSGRAERIPPPPAPAMHRNGAGRPSRTPWRFASDGDAGVLGAEQLADIDRFFRRSRHSHRDAAVSQRWRPAAQCQIRCSKFADVELPRT